MQVGSNKVTKLDKKHVKLGEFTLSTTVSVHLEGDIIFIPIDFFQLLGFSTSYDNGKIVKIDFTRKSSSGSGSSLDEAASLFPVKIGRKYGFMDKSGYLKIQPNFDGASPFSEGLAAVKVDDKWGYADTTGKIVITPQYHTASAFSESKAIVSLEDQNGVKFGYINNKGNKVGNIMYEFALPYKENFAPVVTGKYFAFLNRDGYIQIYKSFEDASSFSEGLARVAVANKYGFIDKSGSPAIPYQYDKASDFSEGLAAVSLDAKWGYINIENTTIIPLQFEDASPFSEGLAAVKKGGKYGFVDPTGKIIISPQFEKAGSFESGFAPVQQSGKWGFINKQGNVVVQPQYDFAYIERGGMFHVQNNGNNLYIDHQGRFIQPLNEKGEEINLVNVQGKVIEVNGNLLNLEVPPALVDGSTLVPLRPILESLNLKLDWNAAKQTITASKDGLTILLQINQSTATVNGQQVALPVPPQIINGSTMVPVRFISQSVGAQVDYTPYSPVEFDVDLFTSLNITNNKEIQAFFLAKENYEEAQLHGAAATAAAEETLYSTGEALLDVQDNLLKEVDYKFGKLIDAAPQNAGVYIQYAILLNELGHLFEDNSIYGAANMIATEAGKIDLKAFHFYQLYEADLYGDDAEIDKKYQVAAAADPYIVLNHVLKSDHYYEAGLAFSKMDSTKDYAIYCLKKAAMLEEATIANKAKQLLASKYKIQQ
ncbi:hypothetical protein J2736_000319 [Paenibacillus qinlingensis]|uniref:Copper amine oxidase-like N-terminal domain-containing protein n=1 Tax=Paenibacillus qinlingensis TaxID=1837343 RepID=A0ABU1NNT2_9BACL|nr:hypothetical protein [Paenibacillus qinlingensis]